MYDYLNFLSEFFKFHFGDVGFLSNTLFDIFGNIFLGLGLCVIVIFPMLVFRKLFFVLVGD